MLREQLVHCDLAHYNVIAERGENGRPYVHGIIDFGDISPTWLVGDLAIAITPLLIHQDRDVLDYVMSIVQGFHRVTALTDEELRALWPLIVMRSILLYVSVSYLLQENPENDYLQEEVVLNKQVMEKCLKIHPKYAEIAIRRAIGEREIARDIEGNLLAASDKTSLKRNIVDISVFSPVYEAGNWLIPSLSLSSLSLSASPSPSPSLSQKHRQALSQQRALSDEVLQKALSAEVESHRFESAAFVAPAGLPWFVRANVRSLKPPKSIPTFSLSFLQRGSCLQAPFDATVRALNLPDFLESSGWKETDLPLSVFGEREREGVQLLEVRAVSVEGAEYDDRVILIVGDLAVVSPSKVSKGKSLSLLLVCFR
jgi:hypothetical protein